MTSETSLGPWSRVRVLGRGGFGLVTLWRNQLTDDQIAIKCLRENELKGIIKPKHKERWCNEVEIMHKIQHKNIVTALPVPGAFSAVQTSVPLLAMEYCKQGDLRQVLVKPGNCCGLKENVAMDILRDVSNGLAYLHSCKVIHRDLKPDNIVIQEYEDTIVYKLIDLGYAKELDQNSLCESFVGTVQYLAPELFLGKPYTCSADYWSFGQVAHEILTGYRPFLPGLTPVAWMRQIQGKKRSVISVLHGWNGDIIHSSSISKINHISSCLREDYEKWLQLALEWDGKVRGRDPVTDQLQFFSALNDILDKKVVRVFSLATCETLTYAVTADTSVSRLQMWLTKDTALESDDQILLLPCGKSLNQRANLLNALPEQRNSEKVDIFLFPSGLLKIRSKTILKPLFVRELLDDPKKQLEYQHLKRSSSDAVFFLRSEAAIYAHMLGALRAKVENIKERSSAVEMLYEDVVDEGNQLEVCRQFFVLSQKSDLENYVELRKSGVISATNLVQKWIKKANDVETRMAELRVSADLVQQKAQVAAAKQNLIELVNHPLMKVTSSPLDDLLKEVINLYDRVQKIPKDVRGHPMSNTDMVRILYKCMEQSAKLLKSSELSDLFLKIFESEDHLAKFVSPLAICLKSTKIMRQIIESTQKERQRDVWSLLTPKLAEQPIKVDKPAEKEKHIENQISPLHIPKTVHQPDVVSPLDENMLRPDFRVASSATFHQTLSSSNGDVAQLKPNFSISGPISAELASARTKAYIIPDNRFGSGVEDIIQTNSEWRYRTADVAQSCHSMVKEIQSLNWDFLDA